MSEDAKRPMAVEELREWLVRVVGLTEPGDRSLMVNLANSVFRRFGAKEGILSERADGILAEDRVAFCKELAGEIRNRFATWAVRAEFEGIDYFTNVEKEKEEDDRKVGLKNKYDVTRLDGKPVGPCIVLEFDDPNSHAALEKWAETVGADGYHALAEDVRAELASRKEPDATFLYFMSSGKWKYEGRGVFPREFEVNRETIMRANGGSMPGISGDGGDYVVSVVPDEKCNAKGAWPRLLWPLESEEADPAPSEPEHETHESVCRWVEETFGTAESLLQILTRANEEMAELLVAVGLYPEKVPEGCADVVMVLCRAYGRMVGGGKLRFDFTSESDVPPIKIAATATADLGALVYAEAHNSRASRSDAVARAERIVRYLNAICAAYGTTLQAEIDRKMAVNRKRTWDTAGDGHGYHCGA